MRLCINKSVSCLQMSTPNPAGRAIGQCFTCDGEMGRLCPSHPSRTGTRLCDRSLSPTVGPALYSRSQKNIYIYVYTFPTASLLSIFVLWFATTVSDTSVATNCLVRPQSYLWNLCRVDNLAHALLDRRRFFGVDDIEYVLWHTCALREQFLCKLTILRTHGLEH